MIYITSIAIIYTLCPILTNAEISYHVRHRLTNPADVIYNKTKQGSVRHFVHLSVYLRLSADLILVKNNYVR